MLVATSGALLLLDESLHATAMNVGIHPSADRATRDDAIPTLTRPMVIPSRNFSASLTARRRQRLGRVDLEYRSRCCDTCVPMSAIQESLCTAREENSMSVS
jgi:hypothetical protein